MNVPTQLQFFMINNFRKRKEIDTSDPEYIKGFNEGYSMTMHLPKIADWIARIKSEDIRYVAFRDGRIQYMEEQVSKMIATFEDYGWDDEE